jgi:hypothetical protein
MLNNFALPVMKSVTPDTTANTRENRRHIQVLQRVTCNVATQHILNFKMASHAVREAHYRSPGGTCSFAKASPAPHPRYQCTSSRKRRARTRGSLGARRIVITGVKQGKTACSH